MFTRPVLPLLLLFFLGSAWAADSLGIQLYERGAYAKASRVLKQEVDNPKRSDELRALSRVYLAASLMALRKEPEAQQQLEELARTFPEQKVDPVLFPPALVEMDRAVRAKLDAERLRQEAQRTEHERLEAEAAVKRERAAAEAAAAERERARERAAAEAAAQRERQAPPAPVSEPPAVRSGSSFRLRPEVLGYANVLGTRSVGYSAGLNLGFGGLDTSVHVLPGQDSLGISLEVGYLFGHGPVQPRVALMGTGLLKTGFGGGAVAGLRLSPTHWLTFLVDVGVERFLLDEQTYNPWVLTPSVGVGVNLL